jgi:hypothetical protein
MPGGGRRASRPPARRCRRRNVLPSKRCTRRNIDTFRRVHFSQVLHIAFRRVAFSPKMFRRVAVGSSKKLPVGTFFGNDDPSKRFENTLAPDPSKRFPRKTTRRNVSTGRTFRRVALWHVSTSRARYPSKREKTTTRRNGVPVETFRPKDDPSKRFAGKMGSRRRNVASHTPRFDGSARHLHVETFCRRKKSDVSTGRRITTRRNVFEKATRRNVAFSTTRRNVRPSELNVSTSEPPP